MSNAALIERRPAYALLHPIEADNWIDQAADALAAADAEIARLKQMSAPNAAQAAPSSMQTYVVGMAGLAKATDNLADAAFWRDRATRAEAEVARLRELNK